MNIEEFYERNGFIYDGVAMRWRLNGVFCGDDNGYLFPEHYEIITLEPNIRSHLAHAADKLALFGIYTLRGIKLYINLVDIVYFDANSRTVSVDISKNGWSVRYVCNLVIGPHLTTTEWALTQMRDVYRRALFKRLPQPIAEEIVAEFIMI